MKILLDPILTASPDRCSTYIQFKTFVEQTLKRRGDVFFYWLLADWVTDEQAKWLPQDPRVRYVKVHQQKGDRTREYLSLRADVDRAVAFNGDLWDFDVLVTVRSGMAALYKLLMISPRHYNMTWQKEVWVIENMPLIADKSSVVTIDAEVQDRFTISGYLAADRVFIISYHEKPMIMQAARKYFPPSSVQVLDERIRCVCPSVLRDFRRKPKKVRYKKGQKFVMAYVGHLDPFASQVRRAYEIMTNVWIPRGDRVELVLLAIGGGSARAIPPDYMDVRRLGREEFWKAIQNEVDVVVIPYEEGGFSMSLLEPLMFGTPVILRRRPWCEALLGDDYPLFVGNETEAYALAKAFYDDYEKGYSVFAKWHRTVFEQRMAARLEEDYLYRLLAENVDRVAEEKSALFHARHPGKAHNEIVAAVVEATNGASEIVLFDVLQELTENGKLRSLYRKIKEDGRDGRGLVWSTPWNEFRLALKAFYGFEDAGVKVGHLRRD